MKTAINMCLNDFISHHCRSLLKINTNTVYMNYIFTGLKRGKIGVKTIEERSSGGQNGGRGRLIEVAPYSGFRLSV